MMNKRAGELGLTHMHFTNAWGRSDPGELVTARDMAALARHLIKDYPEYYHFFGEKDFTWDKIRQQNRNPLLTMNIGADGLKTGDTAESGFGLVGSAVQDGQRLIVVVNGLKTAADRAEEARKLLNWGFRAFDVRELYQPGDVVGRASVFGGEVDAVELTPEAPVKVFVPKAGADKLTAKIVYTGPPPAPVEAGRKLGELRIYQGETLMVRAPLVTQDGGAARQPHAPRRRRGLATRRGLAAQHVGAPLTRGRFITLEGGEGVGKSAQARRLAARLRGLGLETVATREPGGTPHAESLRALILSGRLRERGPAAEALAFSAARIDHIDALIRPALERGAWVVCDRFADSTRAYQGAAGRLATAVHRPAGAGRRRRRPAGSDAAARSAAGAGACARARRGAAARRAPTASRPRGWSSTTPCAPPSSPSPARRRSAAS